MFIAVLLAIAAPAVGAPPPSEAQVEARYTKAYHACFKTGDAARGVTSAMLDCNSLEIDRQDGVLNRTYRATMARLPKARQTQLRTSERAWIKRSDAHCVAVGNEAGGGSAAGLASNSCTLSEIVKRTMWLERYR
ncbi:lysozyme inhibitor LprI family protein [Sphingomonas sp. RB3P16]|uniref:lysozyme inhibitor LprI family protein n=1 Tax=Parasphingomonas frigoris TaxID=3096163 RepID=UPI002FCC5A7C